MTYFVHANDGNGVRRVGHFTARSDKKANIIFESEFKNKRRYNRDGLDLYKIDNKEPCGRRMINTRWRLVTAPRRNSGQLPIDLPNPPPVAH